MGSVKLSSKNIEELLHWCDRMKLTAEMNCMPGFAILRDNVTYMTALDHIMKGDRIASLKFINELSFGKKKFEGYGCYFPSGSHSISSTWVIEKIWFPRLGLLELLPLLVVHYT